MHTIAEWVQKRRSVWCQRHDIAYDKSVVVPSAVTDLLRSPLSRQEIIDRPWLLIEIALSVVDKEQRTVPFFLNEVQRDFVQRLERTDGRPFYILKGRQQGFTTLITAIQLCCAIVRRNFAGATVADCTENTANIFNDKGKVTFDMLPELLKPSIKYSNKKEFVFDKLNATWRIGTAGDNMGRSKTLNFVHYSEVAFYKCTLSSLQRSIGEAITSNSIVVYETTANGYNEAKDLWDGGSCQNVFYEWWRSAEYRRKDTSVLDGELDPWLRERLRWLKDKGLDERQMAWYAAKYASYLDKRSIRQEYPCTPEEAFIASGESIFGADSVVARIDECRGVKPVKRGRFEYDKRHKDDDFSAITIENVRWIDDESGEICIHELPETSREVRGEIVQALKPYAIGGDTAGDGSDYFTAKVIDNITGKTVATYRRQKIDEDVYAEQIYCLGRYYNDAIIGIEVNFSLAPTKHLVNCGYPNLYLRETTDDITRRPQKRYGFATTSKTRPIILTELKTAWRESDGTIECDLDTLMEMMTFVKDEYGKPCAMEGKHDDLVMALAIAHYVGSVQGGHDWKNNNDDDNILEQMFPGFSAEEHKDIMGWDE